MEHAASHNATAEPSSVCIANIGPNERRKRLVAGIVLLAIGVVVSAILVALDTSRLYRLAVFLPFWWGGISTFQVTQKTCVALAAKGVRNLDGGEQAITDEAELRQVKRQARGVQLRGLALGVALTAVVLLLP
ncbi:MAG TPA: hypothetical protein VF103_16675 [Polyangiaceae bacterium]